MMIKEKTKALYQLLERTPSNEVKWKELIKYLRELEKIAVTPGTWWVRLAGYNGLKSLQQELDSRSPEDLKAPAISGSIKETIITLLEAEDNEQIKSIITP